MKRKHSTAPKRREAGRGGGGALGGRGWETVESLRMLIQVVLVFRMDRAPLDREVVPTSQAPVILGIGAKLITTRETCSKVLFF